MKLRNKNTGKIGRVVIAGDSYLITEDNEENRLIGEYQYLKWLLETKRNAHRLVCVFFLEKSRSDRFE